MAVILDFQVSGMDIAIQSQGHLTALIKQYKKELKGLPFASQAYKNLNTDLQKLNTIQKQVTTSQSQLQKATDTGTKSYRAMGAEVNALRDKFINLSAAEKKGAIGVQTIARVKQLKAEMAGIDKQIGTFRSSAAG